MLILNCFQQCQGQKRKKICWYSCLVTPASKNTAYLPHIKMVLFFYIWWTLQKRTTSIPRWFKPWPFYPRSLRVTEPLKGSRELTIWEKRSRKRRIARPKVLSGSRKIDHNIHKKKYWSSNLHGSSFGVVFCPPPRMQSSPPGWRPKHV